MKSIIGIEYGRGCLQTAIDGGPALAPRTIQKMFPEAKWTFIIPTPFDAEKCARDRFGENFEIQQSIYKNTPHESHILIGGDHSVNYGHFTAIRDQMPETELCLVYIDAHLDIHTPETARIQASGAPHGTNVRALMGMGDERWLSLQKNAPVLRPENVFYLGTRSFEPAEIEFVRTNNIYMRTPTEIATQDALESTIREIRERIGTRPFIVSFDFDVIDPKYFRDVLVPAGGGIDTNTAEHLIRAFHDAYSFEFVEYAPSDDQTSAETVQNLIGILINEQNLSVDAQN